MGTRVEVTRSFRDLPLDAWTGLSGSSPELEHCRAYLEYLENIDPSNRLYFVVFRHGFAVAVSQAVLTSARTLPLSRPAEMLMAYELPQMSWGLHGPGEAVSSGNAASASATERDLRAVYEQLLYPSIVVRNLWDCLPLVRPTEEYPTQWWPWLFNAIEAYAQRLGARSVTCLNAPGASSAFGSFLRSRGYLPAHYCAIAEIGLSGITSFAQYLHRFSGDTRRGIIRERRHFKQAGLTVRQLKAEQFLRFAVEQEAQNWAKHGEAIDIDYLYDLRHSLVTHLGAQARLLGAIDADGAIIASGIHLLGQAVYHVFTFGADYTRGDLAASYPELTFYAAIEAALKMGCRTVNLGYEAYQGKVFRGAILRDMHAYVLPSEPGGRRFAESLLAEVSRVTGNHLASVVKPRLQLSGL